jgi:hypothetical protein
VVNLWRKHEEPQEAVRSSDFGCKLPQKLLLLLLLLMLLLLLLLCPRSAVANIIITRHCQHTNAIPKSRSHTCSIRQA